MFIRGKPIRSGYKTWCVCGSDGYPYHLSIYSGKSQDTSKPLRSCVVNVMVDTVQDNSTLSKQLFYFDNFFNQLSVMVECVK